VIGGGVLQRLCGGQHCPRAREEGSTGPVEDQATRAALEERYAEIPLKLPELARQ